MAATRDQKVYTDEQPSLQGGVVSTVAAESIQRNQVARCDNAYPERTGAIRKRRGFEAVKDSSGNVVATDPSHGPMRFLERLVTVDGGAGWVGASGRILWALNDAGVFTTLKTDLDIAANKHMGSAVWQNKVYWSDGVNGLSAVEWTIAAAKALVVLSTKLKLTATVVGTVGNGISCELIDPGASAQALGVVVAGQKVTVNLATGADVLTHAHVTLASSLLLTAVAAGTGGNAVSCELVDPTSVSALDVTVAGNVITVSLGRAAVAASVNLNATGQGGICTLTAVDAGVGGNGITFELRIGTPYGVVVTGSAIVVNMAAGSYASQLVDEINNSVDASALVTASNYWNGFTLSAIAETSLAGGSDNALISTFTQVAAAINADASGNLLVSAVGSSYNVAPAVAETSLAGGATNTGAITSTITAIADAINGDTDASALVDAEAIDSSTAVAVAVADTHLENGTDANGYRNVPVESDYSFTFLAKRDASECLFGIDAADPTTVRYCDPYAPETWDALSVLTPGGIFTSLLEVGRVMLCEQSDRIMRIDGTDPATWEMSPEGASGIGCVVPDSTAEIEGVAVHLSPRGAAYYEGTKVSPFSDAVFAALDTARSLLPRDPNLLDASFSVVGPLHVWFFYKSVSTKDGCDRALVCDFRGGQSWGGPFTLGFEATCGYQDLTAAGTAGELVLGLTNGRLVRQYAGYEDLAAAYTMVVDFRAVNANLPTRDKVYRATRVNITVGAAATSALSLLCEAESSARCTRNFTHAAAESTMLQYTFPAGTRARNGRVRYQNSDDADVTLASEAVELFFCRAR